MIEAAKTVAKWFVIGAARGACSFAPASIVNTIDAPPLSKVATPFARLATPFARLATPFARLATPFARLATPFARLATPSALVRCPDSGHIAHVRKTSLANAKARLSELVDPAEHHGQRIVILRHGKPAAAIVPLKVAVPKSPPPRPTADTERSVAAFVAEFSAAEPEASGVEDLLRSRRFLTSR